MRTRTYMVQYLCDLKKKVQLSCCVIRNYLAQLEAQRRMLSSQQCGSPKDSATQPCVIIHMVRTYVREGGAASVASCLKTPLRARDRMHRHC